MKSLKPYGPRTALAARRDAIAQSRRGSRSTIYLLMTFCFLLAGCEEFFTREADRDVYSLIEKRQQQAIGITTDMRIDGPTACGNTPCSRPANTDPYAFVPNPIGDALPESFTRAPIATQPAVLPPEPATRPAELLTKAAPAAAKDKMRELAEPENPPPAPVVPTQPTTLPATTTPREVLTLEQALAYTFRHSRDFQGAKEQLYLAALNLTLERHLWTPRFFSEISTLYGIQQSPVVDKKGNITLEPDNTLNSVATAGVRQKLPYGGEVVAEVVNSLVRDVSNHLTDGETGQAVIQADLPLLRGAGRSAFETRYQAERNLIYAIRTFEGFRRNLVVLIAADYFNLQNMRQEIINTEQSIQSFAFLADQTRALFAGGRRSVLDVQRADQERLVATNDRLDAITRYQTTLDAFKLRIGMPVETPIDVAIPSEPRTGGASTTNKAEEALEAALRMPAVTQDDAIAAGLKYRLDLLNDLDRIGDAERGINIAENNLLPDLKATTSVKFNTNPTWSGVGHYSSEYNTYAAGLTLEVPLDRVAERNALRRSQINRNEAQRTYEESRYTVILQVRSAMRRVEQQQLALQIQTKNRDLALQRREAARFQLDRGLIGNRDLVEAENALLSARNRLAGSQADLSLAILQFRRDTGTLRVDDNGKWSNSSPLSNPKEDAQAARQPTSRPSTEVSLQGNRPPLRSGAKQV